MMLSPPIVIIGALSEGDERRAERFCSAPSVVTVETAELHVFF
jgi:hypothetical protein